MLGLILYRGIVFTELRLGWKVSRVKRALTYIFITKIVIILVISDHPKYHGLIGTLKITVYFGSAYPKEYHPRLASPFISVYYIKGNRPISLPSIIFGSKISQGFAPYLYCHVPRSAISIKKHTLSRIISYEMASTIKVSRYLISLSIKCWEVS